MTTRPARLTAVVLATIALVSASVVPAQAAQPDPNWWYTGMRVDEAHAAGLTGAGVKVGIVDGFINPDLDVFAGAHLSVDETSSCVTGGSPTTTVLTAESEHGTNMMGLLLARPVGERPVQGIAPDVEATFYSVGDESCVKGPDGRSSLLEGIKRAVDDGNRIVSVSLNQTPYTAADAAVIAEALAQGVVIVTSSANTSSEYAWTAPQQYNGVVSTAAVGADGNLQADLDGTTPVVTPSVTVVAPGIGIRLVSSDDGWDMTSIGRGSSLAAPLVAGSLALLLQKYPSATGNQLIQALIASAAAGNPRDLVHGYGFGAVSVRDLLATDPTTFPDENPLMDKPLGVPTAAEVAAAAGGEPGESETPATSAPSSIPDETDPVTAEPSSPGGAVQAAVPWLIGGGVGVLVIVVVVVIVVATRTRRPSR